MQNGKKSLNKHMREILGNTDTPDSVSARVGSNVNWLPNKWLVTDYPSNRITYLSRAKWNAQRRQYECFLQLDWFTNQRNEKLCDLMVGHTLEKLGLDVENQILACEIPHQDWAGTNVSLPMELHLVEGPETGPNTDDEVIHIWARFYLYFSN